MHDWPDRHIHTNFDTASNIDPTKLKRSAFIAGMSAWNLANLGSNDLPELLAMIEQGSLHRASDLLAAWNGKSAADAAGITRAHWAYEAGVLNSVVDFVPVDATTLTKLRQDASDALPLQGRELLRTRLASFTCIVSHLGIRYDS